MRYRQLFGAFALPLAQEHALLAKRPVDLAFHDARSASAGFSGLPDGLILRSDPDSAVPLTPLSLPRFQPTAFAARPSAQVAKVAVFAPP